MPRLRSALLLVIGLGSVPAAASATEEAPALVAATSLSQDVALIDAPTVTDGELALMRGDFALPDGLDLKLVVDSSTALNGRTVLRTVFRLDQGAPTLQVLAGTGEALATAGGRITIVQDGREVSADAAQLKGLVLTPGQAVDTLGGRLRLDTSQGVSRVSLSGEGFDVIHLSGGAFGTLVANSLDGAQIDTVTNLTINIGNAAPVLLGTDDEVWTARPGLLALPTGAPAQTSPGTIAQTGDLQAELAAARGELARQRQQLDKQERLLRGLEQRMTDVPASAPMSGPSTIAQSAEPAAAPPTPIEVQPVGVTPTLDLMPLDVSVLGSAGSAIASPGAITGEVSFEYARADRNRALFRGVEVLESVLIGVFDISENRQDMLTASGTLRYGITPQLEIGTRIPYVYRNDVSILAPVAGSTANVMARNRDLSAKGNGIGDVEFSARYQLTQSGPERPFLVANLQVVAPTGTSAFQVSRDENGKPTQAATGGRFLGYFAQHHRHSGDRSRGAVRDAGLHLQLGAQRQHAHRAGDHRASQSGRFSFRERRHWRFAQPAHLVQSGLRPHLGVRHRHADPANHAASRRRRAEDDHHPRSADRSAAVGRDLPRVRSRDVELDGRSRRDGRRAGRPHRASNPLRSDARRLSGHFAGAKRQSGRDVDSRNDKRHRLSLGRDDLRCCGGVL